MKFLQTAAAITALASAVAANAGPGKQKPLISSKKLQSEITTKGYVPIY